MSTIIVPTQDGVQFIPAKDILFIKSEDIYAYIHTVSNKIFTTISLGRIEKGLKEHPFFRCHKSYVVNLNHLNKILKGANYKLTLSSGAEIPLSRMKKKRLLDCLNAQKKFITYL